MDNIPQIIKDEFANLDDISFLGNYQGQDVWSGSNFDDNGGGEVALVKNGTITQTIYGMDATEFCIEHFS